jgi:hypothetical protein
MTNLPERLRELAETLNEIGYSNIAKYVCTAAANEIELLRNKLNTIQAVLQETLLNAMETKRKESEMETQDKQGK